MKLPDLTAFITPVHYRVDGFVRGVLYCKWIINKCNEGEGVEILL